MWENRVYEMKTRCVMLKSFCADAAPSLLHFHISVYFLAIAITTTVCTWYSGSSLENIKTSFVFSTKSHTTHKLLADIICNTRICFLFCEIKAKCKKNVRIIINMILFCFLLSPVSIRLANIRIRRRHFPNQPLPPPTSQPFLLAFKNLALPVHSHAIIIPCQTGNMKNEVEPSGVRNARAYHHLSRRL